VISSFNFEGKAKKKEYLSVSSRHEVKVMYFNKIKMTYKLERMHGADSEDGRQYKYMG
jgi:hypothetical protein